MDFRKISTIAVPMADYPSMEKKFDHVLELMQVALNDGANLICLPELLNRFKGNTPATAGDITSTDYALDLDSPLVAPFFELAKKNGTAISLPLLLKKDDVYTNSCLFINEDGKIAGQYNKVHLASGEPGDGVVPGKEPVVVDWREVKVGFIICFDLSFPGFAQKYQKLGAKLVLFPTQFGGGKILNSYAVLFNYYIVSAYSDYSRIVDPFGRDSEAMGSRIEVYRWNMVPPVLTRSINLDYSIVNLSDLTAVLPDIRKKYGQRLKIEIDQGTSIGMIESRSEDVTAESVMSEFGLSPYVESLRKRSDSGYETLE